MFTSRPNFDIKTKIAYPNQTDPRFLKDQSDLGPHCLLHIRFKRNSRRLSADNIYLRFAAEELGRNFWFQVVFWNLIVIIPLLGHVSCLPYGAPNRPYVCQEMFPVGHGTDAQFSDPPFEITVLPNIYSQGQEEFRGKTF